MCQGLGLQMFLPQGAFLRESENQREEVTFPRSHCELLQSPPKTLDSLRSALTSECLGCSGHLLGISWVAEATLCQSPRAPSLENLFLPPYLAEDRGCAQLRAAELAEELDTAPDWLGPPGRRVVPLACCVALAHSGSSPWISFTIFKMGTGCPATCQCHCGECEHAILKPPPGRLEQYKVTRW